MVLQMFRIGESVTKSTKSWNVREGEKQRRRKRQMKRNKEKERDRDREREGEKAREIVSWEVPAPRRRAPIGRPGSISTRLLKPQDAQSG